MFYLISHFIPFDECIICDNVLVSSEGAFTMSSLFLCSKSGFYAPWNWVNISYKVSCSSIDLHSLICPVIWSGFNCLRFGQHPDISLRLIVRAGNRKSHTKLVWLKWPRQDSNADASVSILTSAVGWSSGPETKKPHWLSVAEVTPSGLGSIHLYSFYFVLLLDYHQLTKN